MRAIVTALDYPEHEYSNYFNPDSDDAYAMLRLLHYPASMQQKIGVGEHMLRIFGRSFPA